MSSHHTVREFEAGTDPRYATPDQWMRDYLRDGTHNDLDAWSTLRPHVVRCVKGTRSTVGTHVGVLPTGRVSHVEAIEDAILFISRRAAEGFIDWTRAYGYDEIGWDNPVLRAIPLDEARTYRLPAYDGNRHNTYDPLACRFCGPAKETK